MGLRSDKQRSQRRQILANAFAYMAAHAGELPTMAALARDCGVSDATVFNYVGQREALRSEWAHRALGECLEATEAGGSLRRALRRATRTLQARVSERPDVWLRVFAGAALIDPAAGRPGASEMAAGRAILAARVREAQQRGEVRGDVEAEVLAGALASAWLGALAHESRRALLEAAGATPALSPDAERRIAATVELWLDGLRRRHERVRVASSPRTGAVSSASGRARPQGGGPRPPSPDQDSSW